MAQGLSFGTTVEVNRALPAAVAGVVLAEGLTVESLTDLLTLYWKAGYDYAVQTRLREPVMDVVKQIQRRRGRPRLHADDAARQKAFRKRHKREEEASS